MVLAELLELAPGGVEEEEGPGWIEYAIYGAPGELPDLGSLEALAGSEPIEVSSQEVPDDWADRWRDFHEPILVADRVLVRPSWEQVEAPPAIDVCIDPGQAFGTGAHPTTRMCIELLVELADVGAAQGSLVDLGTGSGVLGIVGAKLGFSPVLGVDHERAALEAAAANAAANEVELNPVRANLRLEPPPDAGSVVANLTAPLLRDVAARLGRAPRNLVCSGLLVREADDVAAAFAAAGMGERDRRLQGDWAALRLSPQ